ncbi:Ger(x)C family spore germination protein [Alkalihalobacillus sp. 1P02AB]|uniref:Ger(x)C family spore germination protein n=1 Tax=Alkalihalobacillus sp. 1P02AB TaxID=3132260 RepID=UPI0039A5B157
MSLLLIPIFLNGCAFKDIDKRAFVTAIGIDESDNIEKKYKVTLKISLSTGDPATTGAEFTLLSFDANSISEALKHMKSMSDKELFYGHAKTILIGEEIASEDIQPLLDYFIRRPDIQRTAYLGVAVPTAHQVLELRPKIEQIAGSYLFLMFEESSTDSPFEKALTLFDAYRRETELGINIAMPIVEVQNKNIQADSIALFSKVGMESKLSPRESELFRLLTLGIKSGSTNILTEEGSYAIEMTKGRAHFKIRQEENRKFTAVINIKLVGNVEEIMDNQLGLSREQMEAIQNKVEKKLQEEVETLLDTIHKTTLDPFGLGLKFNSNNFHHIELSDFYSNLKFEVNVNCHIKEVGLVE